MNVSKASRLSRRVGSLLPDQRFMAFWTPFWQAAQEAVMEAAKDGPKVTPKTLSVGGAWSQGNGQSCLPAHVPSPNTADFLFLFKICPETASNLSVTLSMRMRSASFSPTASTSSM